MKQGGTAGLRLVRAEVPGEHGASGRSAAEALTAEAEQAVATLWARLAPGAGCVIATGDLGRRHLAPGSVVELLVLHPDTTEATQSVDLAVKALSFELWSAGVEVTTTLCPVTDPAELVELATHRFDLEAAFLDGRLLAGDPALWEATRGPVVDQARSGPEAFLARVRRATAARRPEGEDATAALEPNLVTGRGGIADVAAVGWVEQVCGPAELPTDAAHLSTAMDLMHRARAALHRCAGSGNDVLLLPHRAGVALALFGEDAGAGAETGLMRLLYEHSRVVATTLDAMLAPDARPPDAALSFSAALGGTPAENWPPAATRAFLDLLTSGEAAAPGLRWLDTTGTLVDAVPEWAGVRCLPERRNYHRWAVDEHAFRAVAGLGGLGADPEPSVRTAAAALAATPADAETLALAALLHDVGKGGEQDHAERGAEIARTVVRRMGLGDVVSGDVAWLVRNHLLLAHMATRRDISDETLMLEVAGRVATERRLHLLYLLTVSDGRATGPAAWTLWKSTLTARLYTRVLQMLQRGDHAGNDAPERLLARREDVRGALADLPRGPVESHLDAMPRAWLMSQGLGALAEQSRRMIDFHPSDDVRVHPAPLETKGLWELTVVARDRPGLFSRISGVLALHDLHVVGAEIYTRADGIALEVFRVEALAGEPPRFEGLADDARKAMRGRISLGLRLSEKRSGLAVGRASGPPPRVVVDNEASDRFSVVEVHATDRIGLLYTITHAMAELEVDISLAKVSTYGEEVVDVFYVADLDGRKLTDPAYTSELQALISHSVSGGTRPNR
jgi:[protein-PII] uridylyltransferase